MEFINHIKAQSGKLDESWRFAISAFLILRIFYAIWSWVILTIQPIAVHYIDTNDHQAVIFLDLHTINQYAYSREVSGTTLRFRSADRNTVKDLETGSVWDIHTGTATEGYFRGTVLSTTPTPSGMFPYLNIQPYPNAWLAMWQRFDANWYTTIAENGYGNTNGDLAFPPFFPLLISLLKPFFGNVFPAGLFIAHVCTLYALKLLYELFKEWKDRSSARYSLILLLLFPSSFFLFSAYTESLFIVLALLSIHAMQKHEWHRAGFWMFLAILTRLQGLALFIPMLYLMWKDRPFLRTFRQWFGAVIAGSGFLAYLFMRSKFIGTGIFPEGDTTWHWSFSLPTEAYLYSVRSFLSGTFDHIDFLNWIATTLFIFMIISGWRKIPIEYSLFTASYLLINLTRIVDTKPLNSMLRYSLTLFPIFFIIGHHGNSSFWRRLIIYTFVSLNLFLSAEFFGWGWVA